MANRRKAGRKTTATAEDPYKLVKLKDLKDTQDVLINVLGYVADLSSPSVVSRGSTYTCSFTLVDESQLEVYCTLRHTNITVLPQHTGDIVFLRRASMQGKGKDPTLKTDSKTSWAIFRKNDNFNGILRCPDFELPISAAEGERLMQLKKFKPQKDFTPAMNQSQASPVVLSPSPVVRRITHTLYAHSSSSSPIAARAQSDKFPTVASVPCNHVSRPSRDKFYDTKLTPIANLVSGTKEAAVVGVVKFFKPPLQSKGSDWYTFLSLIDDSKLECGLSCVLFNPYKDGLPLVCCPGELVIVKGVCVQIFQRCLQVVGHESTLIGMFSNNPSLPAPHSIGDWYVLKEAEKSKLLQLRQLTTTTQLPLLINSRLEEISLDTYSCTLCVVVTVFRPMRGSGGVVLCVSDGTVPKFSSATDTSSLEVLSNDPRLAYTYQGLTATIVVTVASRPNISAGNVIQLENLYLVMKEERTVALIQSPGEPEHSAVNSEVEILTELVIQDHHTYQGSVKVLPANSPVATSFRTTMVTPEGPFPNLRMDRSAPNVFTQVASEIQGGGVTSITQLQSESFPVRSEHVIDVKVVGVGRTICTRVEDMAQLRCPNCMTLYMTPDPRIANYHQLLHADDLCVSCYNEDRQEGVALCFMYAFSLLVYDQSGQIEILVSGPEAAKFLGLPPSNLYCDLAAKEALVTVLYQMTGGNDPFHHTPLDTLFSLPRPTLRLSVAAITCYSGQQKYRIVNTTLQKTSQ